jgi:hypothetical protein
MQARGGRGRGPRPGRVNRLVAIWVGERCSDVRRQRHRPVGGQRRHRIVGKKTHLARSVAHNHAHFHGEIAVAQMLSHSNLAGRLHQCFPTIVGKTLQQEHLDRSAANSLQMQSGWNHLGVVHDHEIAGLQ